MLILCVSIITAALLPQMKGEPVSIRPHEELSKGQMDTQENQVKDAVLISLKGFTKMNKISASFHTESKAYVFTETGFGVFTFKLQFFTDNKFVDLRQNLSAVQQRERLYMEIHVSSSVPDIQLFVESCKATPHDDPSDPIFYSIIQNGCIKDKTFLAYPGPTNVFRFSIEAPAVFGSYKQVFISSSVILCNKATSNTRCTQGCTLNPYRNQRRRRSQMNETQPLVISQGPIQMKDVSLSFTANSTEDTSSGSKTTVVAISVSVTGGVGALVGIAILLKCYC